MSFTEKAKIVVRGSIRSAAERSGSELQYEPFLCSIVVPRASYPFRENLGRSGKGSFAEKAKMVN